jgi:hypothetical protein
MTGIKRNLKYLLGTKKKHRSKTLIEIVSIDIDTVANLLFLN